MSRVSRALLGASLSLLLLLSACAPAQGPDSSAPPEASGGPSQSGAASSQPDGSQLDVSQPDESQPDVSQPDESQPPQGADPSGEYEFTQGTPEPYDFSQSVPEREAVDNSYFEDAAFIGDSRTDGFLIYSGIGCGENLTSNGISIFKLGEKKALKIDGQSYTLLEALALKQYGKVYLSLGVNELGYYDDNGFYQAYCNAIDAIRAAQPNAVIYIQGLIPLNEEKVKESGGADYLKNDHLLIYNELMKQAAQDKQVAFLDLNPYFADENGSLPADASKDGVHLKSDYCKKWLEYLKTHTVEFEELYPNTEGTDQ